MFTMFQFAISQNDIPNIKILERSGDLDFLPHGQIRSSTENHAVTIPSQKGCLTTFSGNIQFTIFREGPREKLCFHSRERCRAALQSDDKSLAISMPLLQGLDTSGDGNTPS